MKLHHLREGNIAITDMDDRARKLIKSTLISFCKDVWELIKSRTPELDTQDGEDRQTMYHNWCDTDFETSEQRGSFATSFAWTISKNLTNLVNEFTDENNSLLPPRLRKQNKKIVVRLEVKEASTDAYAQRSGGYWQDFESLIKVFIPQETIVDAISGALQTWIFGEGEGIDYMVNRIVPTFIHEFTHYEQWRRGLSGRRTRGYVSAGGGSLYGDQFTPSGTPEQAMRYTGAAHEIEAFAAGAAVELTQDMKNYDWDTEKGVETKRIEELCHEISLSYTDSSQMQRYLWLRQYRNHYLEQGFKGHELDLVFRRFMKILYKKLQQYGRIRIGAGRSIDPAHYPKDWVTYASHGLSTIIRVVASDIADLLMDNKSIAGTMGQAGKFIHTYFYKDEWDFDREIKIEKVIMRLAREEADRFQQRLAG